MAAVTTSAVAMRVVAGSAASGSARLSAKPTLARGVANLKSVKLGKTNSRGALVISAVRSHAARTALGVLERGIRRSAHLHSAGTTGRSDARRRAECGGTPEAGINEEKTITSCFLVSHSRRVWVYPACISFLSPVNWPSALAVGAATTVADPASPFLFIQASAVASGYATALVEACSDKKALESVHGDMETIVAYMAANPSVGTFLRNPTMEGSKVKKVLEDLGKEAEFHPFTKNFLQLLVDKKRIGNIEMIAEEFENLYCEATDTQVSAPPR